MITTFEGHEAACLSSLSNRKTFRDHHTSAAIAVAVQGNLTVDKNQDPNMSYMHSQTNLENPNLDTQEEAESARNAVAANDIDMAAEAAVRGNYWFALWLLGRVMHMYQDEPFHMWVDMSKQHTGKVCKTAFNWTLGWFFGRGKGRKHDIIDLFPKKWRAEKAKELTADVLNRFEDAVRAEAERQGVNPDSVINGLRSYGR